MNQDTLTFYPLYWIYHDNWQCRTWSRNWQGYWAYHSEKWHHGHIHFFMPDFPIHTPGQKGQAYFGKQKYEFSFETLNGPDSGDINQQENITYIGQPKWYFYIEEYWRRIYIQPWDYKARNETIKGIVGRIGLKYDASVGTRGPFREGKNYFFFYDRGARTLPIEYYHDEDKKTRDNFLNGEEVWEFPRYGQKDYYTPTTKFFIPSPGVMPEAPSDYLRDAYNTKYIRTNPQTQEDEERYVYEDKFLESGFKYSGGSGGNLDSTDAFGAFQGAYGDYRYIYPIIEYQKIIRKNYERLPGWELRDQVQGGDGFTISVDIPFSVNDIVQSPFSDDEGNVSPIGTYHHNFVEQYPDQILKYPKYDKCDEGWYNWGIYSSDGTLLRVVIQQESPVGPPDGNDFEEGQYTEKIKDSDGDPVLGKRPDPKNEFLEYRIPDELKGKPCIFKVPEGMKEDGIWVEQCLGGIVKARATIKYRNNFGKEGIMEVTETKLILDEKFEGSDQNAIS